MKSVVITGTSTGIGYQTSKTLIASGYRVFGSVRTNEDADRVAMELGKNFIPLVFDVTDEQAVKESVNKVSALLDNQTLAGLINNAGIAVFGAVQNLTAEEFKHQFDVNLLGVFHCTQAYMDLLGADKDRHGAPGKIINISSISGELAMPFMSAYNMSKFGLEGFSEALRRELMIFGIDVVVVAPGPIKTPIWTKVDKVGMLKRYDNSAYRKVSTKMVRFAEALEKKGVSSEVVAQRILTILTNSKSKTRYRIDAQWFQNALLSLLPKRTSDKMIAKQMSIIKK
ncbi:SDR family NAD(P)-dependent oxidoreductase [Pelagibacterales bacterium]|jgi:NAD(P)-dependent dehydrogenase (short-subunit alcohol dehydrogenase family)|nr:SDR family NAD(P)-dependent oxidoreductase [Pelagibacterales bacterium]|tara:strand:- start:206 stop:1057 length:852 start_codon:yes stop_codon:yes gene_type:complete